MMAEQKGRKPKGGKRLSIRIPTDIHEQIITYCGATKIDASDFLGDAVSAWWAAAPERAKALELLLVLKSDEKAA